MKKEIKVTMTEYISVEVSQPIVVDRSYENSYRSWEDEKWKAFCKKHGFDYRAPYGKIYNLYLELCAERMI